MEIFYPAYYHTFSCLAGSCPDSCCKEWAVDVDPEAAAFYRGLTGALGDRLRSVLTDTEDGTIMQLENGRCPMWQQDGLCWIHAQLGHDALCKTCREFPRLRHDYGDFVELGLELSCPAAAQLILSQPDRQLVQAIPGGSRPEYDSATMDILRQSRQAALTFLATEPDLQKALASILIFSYDVQSAIDGEPDVSLQPKKLAAVHYPGQADAAAFLDFFRSLEILTPQWRDRLAQPPQPILWREPLRKLALYMIRRYWLQSISDLDLVCRVKLVIAACVLVGLLGGEPVQTAQLFSKEIENDPDNLEAILDAAYTSPALTDTNLLALLQ